MKGRSRRLGHTSILDLILYATAPRVSSTALSAIHAPPMASLYLQRIPPLLLQQSTLIEPRVVPSVGRAYRSRKTARCHLFTADHQPLYLPASVRKPPF